jgi:8-oxo-dGTP diphosphatase
VIIEVVGAVIRDARGLLLTVRKTGTVHFMLPGGKREPGEDDLAALAREIAEELGVRFVTAEPLGIFEAAAANEPGARVRSHAYAATVEGELTAAAEIAELAWIDIAAPHVRLAPLLAHEILPHVLKLALTAPLD